jgi:glycosyltransferase involved in cell wall biosynthesis
MKLSFCMTTFNKKELLEITLENYFDNKKSEYQLIISDGYSQDNTAKYLSDLHVQKKVDQIVLSSQRDNGEWEGFKKTLPFVDGQFFYLLTDDDYFDFAIIDKIADFLSKNPRIDYLIANGLDYKENVENLDYHSVIKRANSLKSSFNGLADGVCGLGIFIKSSLISQMELFSSKYGKRTDKTLSLALMNSDLIGATTNLRTYVSIKNEKSNSHLYHYNYRLLEQKNTLNDEPNKSFLVDLDRFRSKYNHAKNFISQVNSSAPEEFIIYEN